ATNFSRSSATSSLLRAAFDVSIWLKPLSTKAVTGSMLNAAIAGRKCGRQKQDGLRLSIGDPAEDHADSVALAGDFFPHKVQARGFRSRKMPDIVRTIDVNKPIPIAIAIPIE
ncbi:MAG TPA: hypothetical protein VIM60_11015, partial [Edaphobacter sp.]